MKILRDTGGSQSFIREGILPFSDKLCCQSSVIVQGIEMGFVSAPLHKVHVQSSLVNGVVKIAVRPTLPICWRQGHDSS